MIKKILLALVLLIAAFLAVVAMQAPTYRVSRSTVIGAAPPVVFANVNDFHQWAGWSPWAALDPNMKTTYSGPGEGTGAAYAWTGDSKVGEGRMEILESRPNELVKIKLDFIKPFASTSTTEFTFRPEGAGTAVEWVMTGDHTFLSKAMCLFIGMDKMIGPDFEKGLAQMKAIAEKR